jgi:pyruvate,orthophosphate dikinase
VLANADTPADAAAARANGAEGVGLVRSEHMFFHPARLATVREMILARAGSAARARALEKLGGAQRDDYAAIFEAMSGLPVTIRLLDPPLHEFLPDLADVPADATAMRAAIER